MPTTTIREESLNTFFAESLAEIIGDSRVLPEAVTRSGKNKAMLDALIEWRGLRLVLECKYAEAGAKTRLLAQAQQRINDGIAQITVVVTYPLELKKIGEVKATKKALQSARYEYALISAHDDPESEIPWSEGDIGDIAQALRHIHEKLASIDIVAQTARSLRGAVETASQHWSGIAGVCDNLSKILEFPTHRENTKEKAIRRAVAARVSALAMANALIFQGQLSQAPKLPAKIETLDELEKSKDPLGAAESRWQFIHQKINYAPIFEVGENVLRAVSGVSGAEVAFRRLIKEAREIGRRQAALRHDLMGRVYHRFLSENGSRDLGKYLGTYYTSTAAATLLLKLALDPARWEGAVDFGDLKTLRDFRVADLACGTGTLLMAANQTMVDAFVLARRGGGAKAEKLHRLLMEKIIHGYDVQFSAVHLTASTLALLAPQTTFRHMHLYVMPMRMQGKTPRLGSIDFVGGAEVKAQLALGGEKNEDEIIRVHGGGAKKEVAHLPRLDLCVMNPPFVSSRHKNKLFGSVPERHRSDLQKRLKKIAKKISANVQAGLGAVFAAVADKHIKPGGRLALVLPRALASGEAWQNTRDLLAEKYHLEIVVVSHDPARPNFSENTHLSEILVVALRKNSHRESSETTFVNLWRNPDSVFDALAIASAISRIPDGGGDLRLPSGKIGEIVQVPNPSVGTIWTPTQFAQKPLCRAYHSLLAGEIKIPGQRKTARPPLCALSALGEIGPDTAQIYALFKNPGKYPDASYSPYAGIWGHNSTRLQTIAQTSLTQFHPKSGDSEHLEKTGRTWESSAADILINDRLRLNTYRVIAVILAEPALGNVWWELKTKLDDARKKALALWLNSSLALLAYYGRRVITDGAWVRLKKPACASMPVLDVNDLDDEAIGKLAELDSALTAPLLPLGAIDRDPVRKKIDDAFCAILDLPDLKNLRGMLAAEPGITGKSLV